MAAHDGKKHSRKSLRDSSEFRELAELMSGIAPERRGDAFKMAEELGTIDGEKENTANDTSGGAEAGNQELR